jgi:hypothetical protein
VPETIESCAQNWRLHARGAWFKIHQVAQWRDFRERIENLKKDRSAIEHCFQDSDRLEKLAPQLDARIDANTGLSPQNFSDAASELLAGVDALLCDPEGPDLRSLRRKCFAADQAARVIGEKIRTARAKSENSAEAETRPKRGAKRLSVLSTIEHLTELGQYGWTPPKIAKACECSPKTVQNLVRNDAEINAAWKKYQSQGSRRPPPNSKTRRL